MSVALQNHVLPINYGHQRFRHMSAMEGNFQQICPINTLDDFHFCIQKQYTAGFPLCIQCLVPYQQPHPSAAGDFSSKSAASLSVSVHVNPVRRIAGLSKLLEQGELKSLPYNEATIIIKRNRCHDSLQQYKG